MMTAQQLPDRDASFDDWLEHWRRFGGWLRDTYLGLGLDRLGLAKASGLGYGTLTHLEAGSRVMKGVELLPNPTDKTVIALARGLRQQPGEVFRRIGGRRAERPPMPQRPAAGQRDPREELAELQTRMAEDQARLDALVQRLGASDEARPAPPSSPPAARGRRRRSAGSG